MAKGFVDELSFMGASMDPENFTFAIPNGNPASYKGISNDVRARETLISFDELNEKLITCEVLLNEDKSTSNNLLLPPALPPSRPIITKIITILITLITLTGLIPTKAKMALQTKPPATMANTQTLDHTLGIVNYVISKVTQSNVGHYFPSLLLPTYLTPTKTHLTLPNRAPIILKPTLPITLPQLTPHGF